ncbi:MAG: hypothetical protein IKQ20_09310 [Bacteroidales bacterium]|nr:hypothetical protein [Bacteroidales bacterium]
MRFRDFLMKTLLADTDYLVGYDADGNYIRVPKSALFAGAGFQSGLATITVQYSANGESWHDNYAEGDIFVRIKAGSGAWSDAIRICISAYDIWLSHGNTGTESDFLESLRGPDGDPADLSELQLTNINGYENFLEQVGTAIDNAKAAIIEEVATTATERAIQQFTGLQLEETREVASLSESDYLTVVTADGLRKIKISSLANNVAVRNVSIDSLAKAVDDQLTKIELEGEQDGENLVFTPTNPFVAGTSHLFLNGQRLVSGVDYSENGGRSITLLNQAPEASDNLTFIAVKK